MIWNLTFYSIFWSFSCPFWTKVARTVAIAISSLWKLEYRTSLVNGKVSIFVFKDFILHSENEHHFSNLKSFYLEGIIWFTKYEIISYIHIRAYYIYICVFVVVVVSIIYFVQHSQLKESMSPPSVVEYVTFPHKE